ncbi:MAG: hypothetical protein FWE40_03320 [Oscillospiraceae bacterium]|nr:hypothetical protein [Oscillospiraceae bacterium]
MYCKNCDRLIDHNERICHHCNQSSRRRVQATQRSSATPAQAGVFAVILGLVAVGIAVVAAVAITHSPQPRVIYSPAERWVVDEWHEMTTVPWLPEYETVTLAQLRENPDWFEGMHVRVMGVVVELETRVNFNGSTIPTGNAVIEDDELQLFAHGDFWIFNPNISLWFYGVFSDASIIVHNVVPVD